ncbi:hypothetical protein G3T14_21715 [Methylobacterium sp. BTF04]|uniref:hypothetical protein n=1 Tax=Methylobacterium sp. BTF04 TaxID=2708300 RepID=UPI0013D29B5B|nr:hypothetical protein [Methylobacterium sp. BTF04]NEU14700.1 hypothetical protein [Methylobacterium sp. BTF04]
MTDTYDIIAISDRGVYAICSEDAGEDWVAEFVRDAHRAGNRTERVTTAEACRRHLAYLGTLDRFQGLIPTPADPGISLSGRE